MIEVSIYSSSPLKSSQKRYVANDLVVNLSVHALTEMIANKRITLPRNYLSNYRNDKNFPHTRFCYLSIGLGPRQGDSSV